MSKTKIQLTPGNLRVLAAIKKIKKGVTASKLADILLFSSSGLMHHIKRLKSAGKVGQNKKTKVWFIK